MLAPIKSIWLVLACLLLSACASYRIDPRVLGLFEASSGETIIIQPDGRIIYSSAGKREFIGLVSTDDQLPITILVIAPDTSPFIGTKLVFSADLRQLTVDWHRALRAGGTANRPTLFRTVAFAKE